MRHACPPGAPVRAGIPGSAWLRGAWITLRRRCPNGSGLGHFPDSRWRLHPCQVTLARTGRSERVSRRPGRWAVGGLGLLCALGCGPEPTGGPTTVTVSGSVLGAEGQILRRQLERFDREHAEIRVEQRPTPDAADHRHQLYVQWLNARASDPDILQVDAIWTPEFAAAGWILPLDRFASDTADFFPVTIDGQPVAGPALRACPGSSTSGCSTGEPISCREAPRPPGTSSTGRRARDCRRNATLRSGVAGRALRGTGDGVPRVPRRRSAARILDGGRVSGGGRAGRAGAHPDAGPDPPARRRARGRC